jgi:hypothetical protein
MRRNEGVQLASIITILCDADLGGNKFNSRSRTSWYAYFFNNLVGWNSRLQPAVSLSTAESEYMALAAACQFAVWFKQLVTDFGVESAAYTPVTILGDNQSAQKIAKNPITHKYSRHIDRRLHWIKEHVRNGNLRIGFVPTANNVSDIGTKALAKITFLKFRDFLLQGYSQSPQPDAAFFIAMLSHLAEVTGMEPCFFANTADTEEYFSMLSISNCIYTID